MVEKTRIPTLHVVADSLPEAYYQTIKGVWEKGISIRTQYDRKDDQTGEFIDPPSRDARVLVEIKDPFKQPRFPPLSFCEIGKYIAEMCRVKDHLVIPRKELEEQIKNGAIETLWPYSYPQRIYAWPKQDGTTLDQVETAIERVAQSPYTRRAVISTAVPDLDAHLKEDLPCLREIQLRCVEEDDILYLHITSTWRSRDDFKAFPDNILAVTFLAKNYWAKKIEEKTGKKVVMGSYADFSMSLHIYGQDFRQVRGSEEDGIKSFFENFKTPDAMIAKSRSSEEITEKLILLQLEDLLGQEDQWRFGEKEKGIIEDLRDGLKTGRYTA